MFLPDEGRIRLDGRDITFEKEHKRAAVIGRIFQDTTKGTAPGMTIEENLALAYLRSTGKRSLMGITAADRKLFREKLAQLDLGLGGPSDCQGGAAFRRTAASCGAADEHAGDPEAAAAG